MSEGGQQRAFANRIKLQSAQQIRQSTRATVKAATEKVSLNEAYCLDKDAGLYTVRLEEKLYNVYRRQITVGTIVELPMSPRVCCGAHRSYV